MEIRKATIDDLALVSAVEADVFLLPRRRRRILSKRGSLITAIISGSSLKRGKLISFADGMVTNLTDLTTKCMRKQTCMMNMAHGR